MKPSRIVKSAWKQAGKPCSLKEFARLLFVKPEARESQKDAVPKWFAAKREQQRNRKSVQRRANCGHSSVHAELRKRVPTPHFIPRKELMQLKGGA